MNGEPSHQIVEIAAALMAFAAAVLLAPVAAWTAKRLAYVNAPNPIVVTHIAPVPYGGGAVVLTSLALAFVGVSSVWPGLSVPWNVLAGCAVLVVFGVVDEIAPFRPAAKFLGQLVCTAAALTWAFPSGFGAITLVEAGLCLFLTVAMLNAVNFLDVSDGFAASIVAGISIAAAVKGNALAAAIAGACSGFAIHNWRPARIYLGDSGSHVLGFLLTVLALKTAHARRLADWLELSVILPVAAITLTPLFELCFVTAMRVARGDPWWRGGPDHIALRLQKAGYRREAIALGAGLASACIALIGLGAAQCRPPFPAMALITLGVASIGMLSWILAKTAPDGGRTAGPA